MKVPPETATVAFVAAAALVTVHLVTPSEPSSIFKVEGLELVASI